MLEKNKKIDKIDLTPEEKEVLLLLDKMDNCLYGNIFKELNLPYTKGAEIIFSLTSKGYIENVGRSSFYELKVKLK